MTYFHWLHEAGAIADSSFPFPEEVDADVGPGKNEKENGF
jgi:hypothetical protein